MLMRTDPLTEWFGLPRAPEPNLAAMNAYRHGDVVTVQFDLPGVDASSIDLQIERGELRLQAQRKTDAPDGARFITRERGDTTVTRRVMLGDVLDVDHVDATFRDGVLTLHIPLSEAAKPRQIAIKGNEALEAGEKVPVEAAAR